MKKSKIYENILSQEAMNDKHIILKRRNTWINYEKITESNRQSAELKRIAYAA